MLRFFPVSLNYERMTFLSETVLLTPSPTLTQLADTSAGTRTVGFNSDRSTPLEVIVDHRFPALQHSPKA